MCTHRKRKIYEPPRFMTINQCIDQLLEIEETRKEGGTGCRSSGLECGVSRLLLSLPELSRSWSASQSTRPTRSAWAWHVWGPTTKRYE